MESNLFFKRKGDTDFRPLEIDPQNRSLFASDRPLGLPVHNVGVPDSITVEFTVKNIHLSRDGRVIMFARQIGVKPTKRLKKRLHFRKNSLRFYMSPNKYIKVNKRYIRMMEQKMYEALGIPKDRLNDGR